MFDTIPFTSIHSNLEHGLAILTESFSPLRSVLHNLSCLSPKQKWLDKPCYSYLSCTTTGKNRFELVWASHNQLSSCGWSKAKADAILSHYFNHLGWKALFQCNFFVLSYCWKLDLNHYVTTSFLIYSPKTSGLRLYEMADHTRYCICMH